eukprot:gene21588-18393_t
MVNLHKALPKAPSGGTPPEPYPNGPNPFYALNPPSGCPIDDNMGDIK